MPKDPNEVSYNTCLVRLATSVKTKREFQVMSAFLAIVFDRPEATTLKDLQCMAFRLDVIDFTELPGFQ